MKNFHSYVVGVVFLSLTASLIFRSAPDENARQRYLLETESVASLNYVCNDTIPTMARQKLERLQAMLREHARYANFRYTFVLEFNCEVTPTHE